MITNDYILLIMNCKKYKYKADIQKSGWLKNLPNELIYFHVIGDTEIEEDYIFDYNSNLLIIKVEDDYNSLPKK